MRAEELRFEDLVRFLPDLGPVMSDTGVSEIMINGPGSLFVERKGKLHQVVGVSETLTDEDLRSAAIQIARRVGSDPEGAEKIVDARLADGSRVALSVPPASPHVVITIRRFGKLFSAAELVSMGSLPKSVLGVVNDVVAEGGNVLIAGGTNSGKTTLLNALVGLLPGDDRVIVIEDTMEIRVEHANCVRFEARGISAVAGGRLTIRDMVRHTLRHRPDHIVIGEVRGEEAADVIQALNTGHGGSFTTVHANSCEGALSRIAGCAMQASDALPWEVTCEAVGAAFQLVVRQSREEGVRGVRDVVEVVGYDKDARRWVTRPVWKEGSAGKAGSVGADDEWRRVVGAPGVFVGVPQEITVPGLLRLFGANQTRATARRMWRRRVRGRLVVGRRRSRSGVGDG